MSLKIVLPCSTFLENGREYSLFEIFKLIGAWVFFYFFRIRHLDTSVWNDYFFRKQLFETFQKKEIVESTQPV